MVPTISHSRSRMDWEPLPPRGAASHRKHRRYSARAEDAEPQKPPLRRRNRPGYNSYLKINIDNETLVQLHGLTVDIRNRWQAQVESNSNDMTTETGDDELQKRETTNNNNNSSGQEPPPKRPKTPLTIRPRSVASLHLTFFFGKETLPEIPADELQAFYDRVVQLMQQRGLVRAGSTMPVVPSIPATLCISGLLRFPPRRHDLIVAELEADQAWHQLHDEIRQAAEEQPSLKTVVAYSKDRWKPHLTLANLYGGNKLDGRALDQLLASTSAAMTARVLSISMGGPMPEQVQLDWTFVWGDAQDEGQGRAASEVESCT